MAGQRAEETMPRTHLGWFLHLLEAVQEQQAGKVTIGQGLEGIEDQTTARKRIRRLYGLRGYMERVGNLDQCLPERLSALQGDSDHSSGKLLLTAQGRLPRQRTLAYARRAGERDTMHTWMESGIAAGAIRRFILPGSNFQQGFQVAQFAFSPHKRRRATKMGKGLIVFLRTLLIGQQSHRGHMRLAAVPVENGNKPALVHRQHGLASAG